MQTINRQIRKLEEVSKYQSRTTQHIELSILDQEFVQQKNIRSIMAMYQPERISEEEVKERLTQSELALMDSFDEKQRAVVSRLLSMLRDVRNQKR